MSLVRGRVFRNATEMANARVVCCACTYELRVWLLEPFLRDMCKKQCDEGVRTPGTNSTFVGRALLAGRPDARDGTALAASTGTHMHSANGQQPLRRCGVWLSVSGREGPATVAAVRALAWPDRTLEWHEARWHTAHSTKLHPLCGLALHSTASAPAP